MIAPIPDSGFVSHYDAMCALLQDYIDQGALTLDQITKLLSLLPVDQNVQDSRHEEAGRKIQSMLEEFLPSEFEFDPPSGIAATAEFQHELQKMDNAAVHPEIRTELTREFEL